jgi:ankyrin repeat protein
VAQLARPSSRFATPISPKAAGAADGWRAPCPLIAAAAQGQTAVVELFLARVTEPRAGESAADAAPPLFKQRSALIYAVLAGHGGPTDDASPSADAVLLMAGQGQPAPHVATWTDPAHRSAVFAAAEHGHGATLAALLSHTAQDFVVLFNCRNATGGTVFHAAARCGSLSALAALQTALAPVPQALPLLLDVVDAQTGTALTAAAAGGHSEMVGALLALGAHVDVPGGPPLAPSPLVAAAKAGHGAVVRLLVKHASERAYVGPQRERLATWINVRDHHGWTALVYAAGNGLNASVRLLLQHGADVNARGHGQGASALMLAAANGRATVVPLLLAAGADLHMATAGNKTAVDLARQAKRRKTVALLEQALSARPVSTTTPTAAPAAPIGRSNSGAGKTAKSASASSLADGAPLSQSTPTLTGSVGTMASAAAAAAAAAAIVARVSAAAPSSSASLSSGSSSRSSPRPHATSPPVAVPLGASSRQGSAPSLNAAALSTSAPLAGAPLARAHTVSSSTSTTTSRDHIGTGRHVRRSSASLAPAPGAAGSGQRAGTGGHRAGHSMDVERDRRYESVGKIRYNRSQRLGTGSQGTMVYQGFYDTHPAAIKRMHRVGQGGPLDPLADKEIHVLIALGRSSAAAAAAAAAAAGGGTSTSVAGRGRRDAWSDGPAEAPVDDVVSRLIAEGRQHIVHYYGRVRTSPAHAHPCLCATRTQRQID